MTVRSAFRAAAPAACAIVLLLACAKDQKSVEGGRIASEAGPAAVAFGPGPAWTRSVAVLEPGDGTGLEKTLFDAFRESFVDRLSRYPSLAVSRRSFAMPEEAFSGKPDLVLSTAVSLSGDTAAWSLSLADPAVKRVLWREAFRLPIERVTLAADAAALNAARLTGAGEDGSRPGERPAFPQRALFRTWLAAVAQMESGGREGFDIAVRDFKAVLAADSAFAPAWRDLSRAYLDIVTSGTDRNRVWPELAKDAALRALRIDSSDGLARTLLGRVEAERGDFRTAIREAKRAAADRPNHPDAWILLGQAEASGTARVGPAMDAFRRGLELDPASVDAASGLALLLTGGGRLEEAAGVLDRALLLTPGSTRLQTDLALVRLNSGDVPAAAAEIRTALSAAESDPFTAAVNAMILAASGKADEALGTVALGVDPYAGNNASLRVASAAVYAMLGRNGLAVASIEKALSLGYIDYPWMSKDPHFDGLRSDVRFQDCLKRLKSAWEAASEGLPAGA
jgi:tetratricopeptide (TPR) repeat protein